MKYVSFCADFSTYPVCYKNMKLALRRLGELDPLDVKKTTLNGIRVQKTNLSEKDLFNRGVLTVRKALNRNLGKSGKYTNRMIRKTSKINAKEKDGILYLTTSIPKKDTKRIISITYTMLWAFDNNYCISLLNTESNAEYKEKLDIKNVLLKTIFPIQTNIILRSQPETAIGKEIKEHFREVSYV